MPRRTDWRWITLCSTVKKLLCFLICFAIWGCVFPCFASGNNEEILDLLPRNINIDDTQLVIDINGNTNELLRTRNELLSIVPQLEQVKSRFLRDGGDMNRLREILRNDGRLLLKLQALVDISELLLNNDQLDARQREIIKSENDTHKRLLQELVDRNRASTQQVDVLTVENRNLRDSIARLEEGNPPCGLLGYIDNSVRWSTCFCVNPDLAHRLPRKFWYGVASGTVITVITCIGLTVLYRVI